jgi:hypothetical protein
LDLLVSGDSSQCHCFPFNLPSSNVEAPIGLDIAASKNSRRIIKKK